MKTRLWIVLLIVVAWTSFLIGYSVSALTGVKPPAAEVKGAGGIAGAAEGSEAGGGRGRGKVQGWGRRLQRRRRTPEDRRCASQGRSRRLRQQGLVNSTTILGGGLAGLSAGLVLTRAGRRVLVLEREPTLGGLARTIVRGAFRFDLGGHRFFTRDKGIETFLRELMGGELLSVPRKSQILLG